MELIFLIIALGVYLVIAHFTGEIAKQRGQSYKGFFIFSLFAPLIALLVAAFLGENPNSKENRLLSPSGDSKKCPFCAEIVKKEAKICRFCGKDLPEIEFDKGEYKEVVISKGNDSKQITNTSNNSFDNVNSVPIISIFAVLLMVILGVFINSKMREKEELRIENLLVNQMGYEQISNTKGFLFDDKNKIINLMIDPRSEEIALKVDSNNEPLKVIIDAKYFSASTTHFHVSLPNNSHGWVEWFVLFKDDDLSTYIEQDPRAVIPELLELYQN